MAGLAAARARGRTGGRPRLMTRAKLRTAMTMMADQGNARGRGGRAAWHLHQHALRLCER